VRPNPEHDPFVWHPPGERPAGPDPFAAEVASRIDALAPAPGDGMNWAAIAAGLEREAAALGAAAAAGHLLHEAGRAYEEHLGDPPAALALYRRALALDPTFLPNARACRRLAMERGEDALAAEAVDAEASAASDPRARAELLLLRGRLLAGLGHSEQAWDAIERAAAVAPAAFSTAEESARLAAASGDRAALAEAYVHCARAADDPRLSAHYLSAAASLLDDAQGDPGRAGALALEAFALAPDDPLLRGAARRYAERLRRNDALAAILEAEAEAATGQAAGAAWLAVAHLGERLGDLEAAIAALERARAAAPADPLVLSELARLRETRGAWADACEALDALALAHLALASPEHVRAAALAKLRRADLEETHLGRPLVALACYRDVLEIEPANRLALSAMGRLYAALGDWEGLLAAFEAEASAARDHRERAQRTFKAAEVLEERLGRVEDALAGYRAALALDPDLLPARAALERLCESEGRWEDLCALLESDLAEMRSRSDQTIHLFRIARLREERLGDLEGAAGLYRRMLEIDPTSRIGLPALGAVLARLGRTEDLAALLRREAAATDDPRRKVAVLQRRAELLEEVLDDPELARSAWEEVRTVAPFHTPALRALGRLHARAGRWQELAAMFRAEADASPDPGGAADLVHRVGEILERRLGRGDEALAAYREALVLAPAHLSALQALARLHSARGDDPSLVETLRALAAAHPPGQERAALLAQAARIAEERLGDPERAIENYEEALRVAPRFAPALRALDRLYVDTGRTEALAALRRSDGELAAGRPERLLELARLEADREGDAGAALRTVEALMATAPDHPSALLLELRLAPEHARRSRACVALAATASEPAVAATLLVSAALDLPPGPDRLVTLARAAALAPSSAVLAPEEERRLRASGNLPALARFCEARRDAEEDPAARASWSVRAGEAWAEAREVEHALAAFHAALQAAPASLPALRGARALFAGRGEWSAVRATLQAEGAALCDPEGAVAAWLEAGAVAEQRFGDRAAAASDYRSAAARDPLAPEPLRRLEALGEGATPQLAAAHEARARAERDLGPAAESWLEAARAALDGGAGREAALAALDHALGARPDLAAALELRAALLTEAGSPEPALADLEACLALDGEPPARLRLHLAAAELCAEALHDPEGAVGHLHAALALTPESPEALARLARVHAAAGRPGAAAAALRRLVDVPDLPRDASVEHLLALADADERLGSLDDAALACRRVLALDGGNDEAHRRLLRLESSADPAARLAGLEAAGGARDPALRIEAHLEAAHLLARSPASASRAVRHLRSALALDPARGEARATLAALLDEVSPPEAITEHRLLIAADPLRVASWSALHRHFERARSHDRVHVTAAVLRWLGAPAAGRAAEALRIEAARHSPPAPPRLDDSDLALLRAPGDAGPFASFLEAAGDAMAIALGEPSGAPRAALRDHPLRTLLAEATHALGAPEWEIRAGEIGRVDAEATVPYGVRIGPDVARHTSAPEQRFLLGRAATRLRTRSCLAERLPAAALREVVAAALEAVLAGGASGGDVDEALARRIGKALGRRRRRALAEIARPAARPLPDVVAWRAAASATADRAGLVLCGDVPAALGMLLRDRADRSPEGPAAVAAAATRPDVLALLAFAASEEHFLLRQRLRTAIA
jgi:tetratricopeptide (TPR) repeat protein